MPYLPIPDLAFPEEQTYTDVEFNIINDEPPGLFPLGQDSYWGQMRKVFAAYIQENLVDVINQWWLNLDPNTVDSEDMPEWEQMLDIPPNISSRTLEMRRAYVLARHEQGAFTRARRNRVIEAYITGTFGPAPRLTPDGIPLTSDGIPLYADITSLDDTYIVTEQVSDFHYIVWLLDTIDPSGLEVELDRITPAHISFEIQPLSLLP